MPGWRSATSACSRRHSPAGSHWTLPASKDVADGMQTHFAAPDVYPVDDRAVTYSMGFFSAKHLGEGPFYLMTIVDASGKAFDGARTYRLTVPPNAPVELYWSATVYDRATHALIRESRRSSRASNTPGLAKNADGSIDVYFGPHARRRERSRIGCRRKPAVDSRSSSGSMARRSRSSTRPGSCPTSSESPRNESTSVASLLAYQIAV